MEEEEEEEEEGGRGEGATPTRSCTPHHVTPDETLYIILSFADEWPIFNSSAEF